MDGICDVLPYAGISAASDVPAEWSRVTLGGVIVTDVLTEGDYEAVQSDWRSLAVRWTEEVDAMFGGVTIVTGEMTLDDSVFTIVYRASEGRRELMFCPGPIYVNVAVHSTVDDFVDVLTDLNDLLLTKLRTRGWEFGEGCILGPVRVSIRTGDCRE